MCVAAAYGASERLGRLMIDAVIDVIVGISVRDPREMDHGLTVLQQRFPVEGYGKIRKGNIDHVFRLEPRFRSGCGDNLVAVGDEIRNQICLLYTSDAA